MKRMHSKEEVEEIVNESELAEQVNELAAVYTYEDLTLTEAQYSELTSIGSISFREDFEILVRLRKANVVTIYTNPDHTGKVIIAQRQTLTNANAAFAAFENDNSTLKQYVMDITTAAVNIKLSEVVRGTKLFKHDIAMTTGGATHYFAIITTETREMTSYTDIKALFNTCVECKYGNSSNATFLRVLFIGSPGSVPVYYFDGEIKTFNLSYSGTYTDTVTPL